MANFQVNKKGNYYSY